MNAIIRNLVVEHDTNGECWEGTRDKHLRVRFFSSTIIRALGGVSRLGWTWALGGPFRSHSAPMHFGECMDLFDWQRASAETILNSDADLDDMERQAAFARREHAEAIAGPADLGEEVVEAFHYSMRRYPHGKIVDEAFARRLAGTDGFEVYREEAVNPLGTHTRWFAHCLRAVKPYDGREFRIARYAELHAKYARLRNHWACKNQYSTFEQWWGTTARTRVNFNKNEIDAARAALVGVGVTRRWCARGSGVMYLDDDGALVASWRRYPGSIQVCKRK